MGITPEDIGSIELIAPVYGNCFSPVKPLHHNPADAALGKDYVLFDLAHSPDFIQSAALRKVLHRVLLGGQEYQSVFPAGRIDGIYGRVSLDFKCNDHLGKHVEPSQGQKRHIYCFFDNFSHF